MANRYMKKFENHLPSGKFKSKPQGVTTIRQLERLKLTRQETMIVGEDVEIGDLAYIFGGNASWHSHS